MTAAIEADFATEPYLHQLIEFETSADMEARALLWQMRSGKTKVIVDTACHLYRGDEIDAVVVLAPNGVHENWLRRELPRHHWGSVPRTTLAWHTDIAGELGVDRVLAADRGRWQARHDEWWTTAERMLSSKTLTWFAFNSESMTRPDVRKLIAKIVRRKRVLLVVDESDDFRTPGSQRTKMARALARRCPYRRILTGTVVTNSPLAAFSQFELLKKEALGFKRYGDFKQHHAVYRIERNRRGRHYPVLDRYINLDELTERMASWSSVVLRSDCHDLPDVVQDTRRIGLTDEQTRLYRELHSQFILELNDREVSVGENTAKLMKLQQVLSGFLIDEYGDVHDVPGINPRLEALSDEVYLSSGKVIVWCQFREDLDRVASRLTADGHEIVQYHGRVSDEDKQNAIDQFQNDQGVKCFVGQPQSGGRGIDLSAADLLIWYSHTFNAIVRSHANERATAMGGPNKTLLDFTAGGVDDYMLGNTADKMVVADRIAGEGMKRVLERIAL